MEDNKVGNIIYHEPEDNFKKVNFEVIKNFDCMTIGLYCKIIAMSAEWKLNINGLSTVLDISKEKVKTSIQKLERDGFMKREPVKNENGKFAGYSYHFYPLPLPMDERTMAGYKKNGVPENGGTQKMGYPENDIPNNNREINNNRFKENNKENNNKEKTKTKVLSKKAEEQKVLLTDDEQRFIAHMEKEYGWVQKMKVPLTFDEYMRLHTEFKYEFDQIEDILSKMDNYPNLHKSGRIAYKTALNWLKREYPNIETI